jgi:deazaflavin-dependent oxidoreductase (nitroreductase family)
MGIGNKITMGLLRSPLHGVMSRNLLVLAYEGRKSGRRYAVPLQYIDVDRKYVILAGNADQKTWWRNFEEPAAVSVRIRGRDVTATAQIADDDTEKTRYLRTYLERYPFTTPSGRPKFFGQRWHPDDDELATAAAGSIWVVIEPDDH